MRPGLTLLIVVFASMATLSACGLRYGGSSQDKVLATLRDENAALRGRVAALEREREELVVRASAPVQASLSAHAAAPAPAPAPAPANAQLASQIAQAMPAVVSIEIDSLSGPSLRDPARPIVIVYVLPKDGRNRFTQVVGSLVVEASWKATDPSQPATPTTTPTSTPTTTPTMTEASSDYALASIKISPIQLRDAYRSGFAGTNYAVELPVSDADRPKLTSGTLVLRARLTDLLTAKTHIADRTRVLAK